MIYWPCLLWIPTRTIPVTTSVRYAAGASRLWPESNSIGQRATQRQISKQQSTVIHKVSFHQRFIQLKAKCSRQCHPEVGPTNRQTTSSSVECLVACVVSWQKMNAGLKLTKESIAASRFPKRTRLHQFSATLTFVTKKQLSRDLVRFFISVNVLYRWSESSRSRCALLSARNLRQLWNLQPQRMTFFLGSAYYVSRWSC